MIPFIDMHCDTLTQANFHFRHDLYRLPAEQLDMKRLEAGGAKAQFFAVCLPRITTVRRLGKLYEGDWAHIRRLAGILHHTCQLHSSRIAWCETTADLEVQTASGKISAILAVEDGRVLLISQYGLDVKFYHETGGSVTWATSTLRKWLNNEKCSNSYLLF